MWVGRQGGKDVVKVTKLVQVNRQVGQLLMYVSKVNMYVLVGQGEWVDKQVGRQVSKQVDKVGIFDLFYQPRIKPLGNYLLGLTWFPNLKY